MTATLIGYARCSTDKQDLTDLIERKYLHKPKEYANEKEWRLVVTLKFRFTTLNQDLWKLHGGDV